MQFPSFSVISQIQKRGYATTHKGDTKVTPPPIRPDGEYDIPMFKKDTDPKKIFNSEYMERPFDIYNRRAFFEPPYRNNEVFFWDRLSYRVRHGIRTGVLGFVLAITIDGLSKYGGGKGFFYRKGEELDM